MGWAGARGREQRSQRGAFSATSCAWPPILALPPDSPRRHLRCPEHRSPLSCSLQPVSPCSSATASCCSGPCKCELKCKGGPGLPGVLGGLTLGIDFCQCLGRTTRFASARMLGLSDTYTSFCGCSEHSINGFQLRCHRMQCSFLGSLRSCSRLLFLWHVCGGMFASFFIPVSRYADLDQKLRDYSVTNPVAYGCPRVMCDYFFNMSR